MGQESIGRLKIYKKRELCYKMECETLEASALSKRNKELILLWHNHLLAGKAKNIRVAKLSSQLRRICTDLNKDLDTLTIRDLEALLAKYAQVLTWTETTKADYRRCVKQFFSWYEDLDLRLRNKDDSAIDFYKYLKKHVRSTFQTKGFDHSLIITDQEIDTVLREGCRTMKERAFIKVLHEGGFRIDEHLNIRFKDLEEKQDRIIVQVDGKTGIRRVPLVQSVPLLTQWMAAHPFRTPESFLWLGENPSRMWAPILYTGAKKLIDRCFDRAGLVKKRNPHWFRKSRASINGEFMTESIMDKYFGWVPGSGMSRIYCRHGVHQLENSVMAMNGLENKEVKRVQIKQCPCGCPQQEGARHCARCGKPLSVQIALEDDENKSKAIDEAFGLLQKIMTDPALLKQFEQFKAKNEGSPSGK